MAIDFDYELKKVKKEIEKLEDDVSKSVRHGLEEILEWAQKGFQKQALREQLKSELQCAVQRKQELISFDATQKSIESLTQAKKSLEGAFSSKTGEKIQQNLQSVIDKSTEMEEDTLQFKLSIKSKYSI